MQQGLSTSVAMRREVVGRPLPYVPGHVVEPVAVGREAADGRRPLVPVEGEVLPRELALPRVGGRPAVRKVLVAPGERCPLETSAGRQLPLRLRRELLPGPPRVRLRILVRDVHDRVVVATVDGGALSAGVLPVRAGDVLPPVAVVVEVHWPARCAEHQRSGHEQLGIGVGVLVRVERPLGERHVRRLAHETPELRGRDRLLVHPEPVDRDAMHRAFLGIEVLRAHRERPTGDPPHAGTRGVAHCDRL